MTHIKYILDLSRKHTGEIGFLPAAAVDRYIRKDQVFTAYENYDPCGFLLWGGRWPDLHIYQACIQYDAQRRRHGNALVARVIRVAVELHRQTISLWCFEELEANAFWRSAGFTCTGQKAGGASRGQMLNCWVLTLPESDWKPAPKPKRQRASRKAKDLVWGRKP